MVSQKFIKKNHPYRIIVSSINTALYTLASFLQKIISTSLTYDDKYVSNSFDLYKVLSGKKIGNTNILLSLDVISLFTNFPQDLAIKGISNRWATIEKNTNIPMDKFILALQFINFILYIFYF